MKLSHSNQQTLHNHPQASPIISLKHLQKPLPLLQQRVATYMKQLGSMNGCLQDDMKLSQASNSKDFRLRESLPCRETDTVLGEQMYLKYVRPICVHRQFMWKHLPNQKINQFIQDQQQTGKAILFKNWVQYIKNFNSQVQQDWVRQPQNQGQKKLKPSFKVFQQHQKKLDFVPEATSILKKNYKKGSKSHQRQANTKKSQSKQSTFQEYFFGQFDILLSTFSENILQTQFGLNYHIVQLKLVTLLYMRWFFDEQQRKRKSIVDEEAVYEYISILAKVVKIFAKYVGKKYEPKFIGDEKQGKQGQNYIEVSETLIQDLKLSLQYMLYRYSFTNTQIIQSYPRLAYDNRYNKHFPIFDIKAHSSQIQLLKHVKNAISSKGEIAQAKTILYNTMVGSGKSTVVIALAQMIKQINMQNIKNGRNTIKLIYACEINSVTSQLAHLCFKKDVKFCIANKVTIKRNEKQWSYPEILSFVDAQTDIQSAGLILSNWQNTYMMLDKHEYTPEQVAIFNNQLQVKKSRKQLHIAKLQSEEVVLFVDEPNFACSNSKKTEALFKILGNRPPKIIILASATLPAQKQMPNTMKMIKLFYPKLQVSQIVSKQFQIGCQFCTFDNKIFYPHTNAKSKKDLENVINKIKQNPFLMRMYSGRSLLQFFQKASSKNIFLKTALDIQSPDFSYKNYPELAIQMLSSLIQNPDEVIEQLCQGINSKAQNTKKVNYIQGTEYYEPPFQNNYSYINFNKMFKQNAHKFLGGCLIFASDPIQFASEHLGKWVRHIPSLKKLFAQNINLTAYQQQQQLRHMIGKAENQKQILRSKTNELLPAHKKINTIHHYNYYALPLCSYQQNKINCTKLSLTVGLEQVSDLYMENSVDQFLIKLLLCGVGLYTEQGLPRSYLEKVEEFANQKKLAFIISDRALLFGTNFPISNVILLDNLADDLELNEVFQLVGRAGRVGKSWTARAFFESNTIMRLLEYTHGKNNKAGSEAQIFQDYADQILRNPQLKLRTKLTEISTNTDPKYKFMDQPVKITIRLPQPKTIKRISLVVLSKDKKVLSKKHICKNITQNQSEQQTYYQLPNCPLLFQDIPLKQTFEPDLQSKCQEHCIDIAKYYQNESKYISLLLSNAVSRLLSKVSFKITNQFSHNNIQDFYNPDLETYVVFAECQQQVADQELQIDQQNYKFNLFVIGQQQYESIEEQCLKTLTKINDHLRYLSPILYTNPLTLHSEHFSYIKAQLQQVGRAQYQFYWSLYGRFKPRIDKQYEQIFRRVQNRESILYEKQIKMIIFQNFVGSFCQFASYKSIMDSRVCQLNCIKREFLQGSSNQPKKQKRKLPEIQVFPTKQSWEIELEQIFLKLQEQ